MQGCFVQEGLLLLSPPSLTLVDYEGGLWGLIRLGLLVLFLLCHLHILYLAWLIGLLSSGCWGDYDKLLTSLSRFLFP